uniref:Epidermal growth factor receptor substrate 15-like 1 n=1 Tax=Timema shepardi TaxID=629360 RepID=A0A7R9ATY0_TIMSH|nr:unnamed protein product [Timema shepardi]
MASLPSPTQVSGIHTGTYEAYYRQVDPNNHGSIGALDAARFLKKSGLSDIILSKVWDLSDPAGKGYLNKGGFFVALKLVALAQSGQEVNMVNIMMDTAPPKMGDIVPVMSVHNSIMSPPVINNSLLTSDWAVKPAERARYDQLFDSLQPLNGMIPGNKVKGLLMDSKLPLDTLGKIWDLADQDKDGMLDRHEFMVGPFEGGREESWREVLASYRGEPSRRVGSVSYCRELDRKEGYVEHFRSLAMHLVYKALEKYTIPNSLPPELMPPVKRKEPISVPVLPGAVKVMPNLVMPVESTKPSVPPLPVSTWVVTADEKSKYDTLFHQTDVDKDGFVSGFEIKDVFLRSGVTQSVLAHIWTLCDIKQSGKLNGEQFALAMWLINQKLQGLDPPAALTSEMIPPSFRSKPPIDGVIEVALCVSHSSLTSSDKNETWVGGLGGDDQFSLRGNHYLFVH